MCSSVLLNGLLGFGMCITLLFCVGDIDLALKSHTGLPFIQIYTDVTRSNAAGTGLVYLICMIFKFLFGITVSGLYYPLGYGLFWNRNNGHSV